jgi:hypothetical protein
MTTDRALYEKMYARQLAEGATLEQAMRSNRASTPEDYLRAFGSSDDPHQQWRKIGGGNKMGSAGASINAKRRAQKKARDARGESDPIVSRITAFVNKLAGKEASDDSTTERTSDYRTPKERRNRERMAGEEVSSVFGPSTLEGTLMAVTPWAKVGAWEKNFLQDSLRNIQRNQPGAYDSEKMRLTNTYPGFQA